MLYLPKRLLKLLQLYKKYLMNVCPITDSPVWHWNRNQISKKIWINASSQLNIYEIRIWMWFWNSKWNINNFVSYFDMILYPVAEGFIPYWIFTVLNGLCLSCFKWSWWQEQAHIAVRLANCWVLSLFVLKKWGINAAFLEQMLSLKFILIPDKIVYTYCTYNQKVQRNQEFS